MDKATKEAVTEGWVYISGARKWQYVGRPPDINMSLCKRWLYLGSAEPEQGNDDSSDNCAACRKALALLTLARHKRR